MIEFTNAIGYSLPIYGNIITVVQLIENIDFLSKNMFYDTSYNVCNLYLQ